MIIRIEGGDVQPGIGQIMQVVVSVFAVQLQAVVGCKGFPDAGLDKEIVVPLPVLVCEYARIFPYAGAGVAAVGMVVIGFYFPIAVFDLSEYTGLQSKAANVSIFAFFRCIVAAFF